ncbi:MAG TPA: TIGR01244 family sulfur transferase [Usitatibacter sp.]|nr:TIGR01244 family sulfur transferase [Usitatibacter sp.]
MSHLPLNYLAPDFAVAPQLTPDQMRGLAASGFRSVVNNRLAQESGQPPEGELREAATASNLAYVHLPVHPARITIEDVARFAELIEHLPRPIVAFCRSGSRSGLLYQAVMQGVHLRAAR